MALKEIIEEYENTREPRLDEMKKWFDNNHFRKDLSTIQRFFGMGYRQANRALKQLNETPCL